MAVDERREGNPLEAMATAMEGVNDPPPIPLEGSSAEGETEEQNRRRFTVELEFVQCLANVRYLHHLRQQRYFADPAFLNYLKYLTYWKRPEYAKFIMFPQALYFLDLIQDERALLALDKVEDIKAQQENHWRFYYNNR